MVRPGEVRIDTSPGSADEAKRVARVRKAEHQRQLALRRTEILQRRINGQTFSEIATVLGLSETAVRKQYRAALKDHYRTAADEERETALLRADNIIRRWSPRLLSEDDEVAERATRNLLRAMHFQADLWGMKSHTVHVDGEVRHPMPTGAEVWGLLEQIRATAAASPHVIDTTAALVTTPPSTNGHPNGNGAAA